MSYVQSLPPQGLTPNKRTEWPILFDTDSLLLFSQTADTRILQDDQDCQENTEDCECNDLAGRMSSAYVGTPELDIDEEDEYYYSDGSGSENGINCIFREYEQQEEESWNETTFSQFDNISYSSESEESEESSFEEEQNGLDLDIPESEAPDKPLDERPILLAVKVSTTTKPLILRFTRPPSERNKYPTPTTTSPTNASLTYPQAPIPHKPTTYIDPDALFSDDGSIFSDDDDLIPDPVVCLKPPKKRVRTKYRPPVKRAAETGTEYFSLVVEPRKKRGRPRKNPLWTVVQKAAMEKEKKEEKERRRSLGIFEEGVCGVEVMSNDAIVKREIERRGAGLDCVDWVAVDREGRKGKTSSG